MNEEQLKNSNIKFINETNLMNWFSSEFNCGAIVFGLYDNDSDELFKELKRDICKRYSYIPFWCEGSDGNTISIKRCLVIPNQMSASSRIHPDDNLVEYGKILAELYYQNQFIYKPKGFGHIGYSFDLDKNKVSKHEFYADCLGNLIKKYFTERYHFKNYEFYMQNAPNSVAEARKRYGESFFRF